MLLAATALLGVPTTAPRHGGMVLDAQTSSQELQWIGPNPNFLPSVDCIQIVTLHGSEVLPILLKQLSLMGMSARVNYTQRFPDVDGKDAGCFRGHVEEWKAAVQRGCHNTLMLEDDAIFNGPVLQQAMKSAEAFLDSATSFGVLLLGWASTFGFPSHLLPTQLWTTATPCVYRVKTWFETHAYVISRELMEALQNEKFHGIAIDVALSNEYAPNSSFVVSPKVAFQALHSSQAVAQNPTEIQTGSLPEVYNESPFTWYNFEEPRVFENSNINRSSECLAPQPIDVFARPILEPPPNEFP
ncbi:hypothetical protein AB1Y20_012563 [Prymnesium parvum]|uniref:Glycosyl transferase family 25 domain-containing protein n=1 Tax=Prymnesium parvum TaxID=97485 RepID=A0AB34IKZ9_PRYPA